MCESLVSFCHLVSVLTLLHGVTSVAVSYTHLDVYKRQEEEVTGFLHAFADCYNTLTR